MAEENVVIPKPVLDSVETLDELQDWLTANNPGLVAELKYRGRTTASCWTAVGNVI